MKSLPRADAPWCYDGSFETPRPPWPRHRLDWSGMTTNRTPINRPPRSQFTPEALAIFCQLRALPPCDCDGCDRCNTRWDLYVRLHDALQLKPWQWPGVDDPEYPRTSDADAWAMWRELAAMR